MIWDALGGLGFVLALALLMGAFRKNPPRRGCLPPDHQQQHQHQQVLLGVIPPPRTPVDQAELAQPAVE